MQHYSESHLNFCKRFQGDLGAELYSEKRDMSDPTSDKVHGS